MSIEVDPKNTSNSDRMAFILGYTGETGKALVKELSKRKVFKKVMLVGRREVQLEKDLGPEFAGFIKVDHDYVVNAAAMAKSVGCKHFLVGEVEEDLKSISFDNLSIFRPGMLLCDRVERRPIEACIRCCWKPMPRWFVKEGAINTDNLAAAMVNKALNPSSEKVETIENKQIYELI
ncbi:HTATIP2 [Mytilus edulis]|uniref:HTATIP2 n=1 Tax=Mytilus edulis TaxID=6550 RepID=A0A8S3U8L4_MYTED|nr:HTATIP2 [Mytilus edulis]